MTKQKIFIADKISTKGVEALQGEFDVDFTTGLSEDEVCKHVSGVDAIIVRSTTKITSKILDCADQLKVIGRAGIGVDNIDVVSATERGIVVLNTPDANATTTAELAIAHMLSLSRHLPDADRSVPVNGRMEALRLRRHRDSGKNTRCNRLRHYWAHRCIAGAWAEDAGSRA